MTSKHCPKPRLQAYKPGESFCGSIISLVSAERGVFYAFNRTMFDQFYEIESFKPNDVYHSPPAYGEVFLYVNQNKNCYRAYRLNTNPASPLSIRAFLIDIGNEIHQNFKKGSFYRLPTSFTLIPPMAIFCYVEIFPAVNEFQTKSEFLETSVMMEFKFNTKEVIRLDNKLAKYQRCLVVNIEEWVEPIVKAIKVKKDLLTTLGAISEVDEGSDSEIEAIESRATRSEDDKMLSTTNSHLQPGPEPVLVYIPRLTYLDDDSDHHVPFTSEWVSLDFDQLPPGSKIMIFQTEVVSPRHLYARYLKQDELVMKISSEAMALHLWMNYKQVIKNFNQLEMDPVVDEMVIAQGRDNRFHRGRVEKVGIEFHAILFIDFGYTLHKSTKTLYKFPRQFSTLPAQVAHLSIANMTSFGDHQTDIGAMTAMELTLRPNAFAHVISSSHSKSQRKLLVNIYNIDGTDIVDILIDHIQKPLASACLDTTC